MNQDTENFEKLRRLLALKRYEQPPPRYFNDFSSEVIARIKAGERGNFIERLLQGTPWFQRIWKALEARPALAGGFGVALCGLLLAGLIYSDKTDPSTVALVPTAAEESAPMALATSASADRTLAPKPVLFEPSGTNPIATAQMEGSLMGDIGSLRAQPASFSFPAGTDQ